MVSYQTRLNEILDHIESHLDNELSVYHLSRIAKFSKYHFHRQFFAQFELNVSAFIKHLRINRATYQLVYRMEMKVIDIALQCGYESPEAFSRAFKQAVGQTPTGFRKIPDWGPWHKKHQSIKLLRNTRMLQENKKFRVEIIEFHSVKVAVMKHLGPPETLGHTISRFINWRKENKLPPTKSRTFNLVYDDPGIVDAECYRFDLCASINQDVQENDYGVVDSIIPSGRCAMIRHIGADDNIDIPVKYLYKDWLEQSGEKLRDFPLFFERVSFFPEVLESKMVTDIYLPLES